MRVQNGIENVIAFLTPTISAQQLETARVPDGREVLRQRGAVLMSAERIRALNDQFRTTFRGGRVMMTAGVDALPPDVKAMAILRVATFSEFTEDNDPHEEHDFGSFELAGRKFFWKIDAYDADMRFGSEDPADPEKTTRVLTIITALSRIRWLFVIARNSSFTYKGHPVECLPKNIDFTARSAYPERAILFPISASRW